MSQSNDKGLFRRKGSPFWFIRYADRNGRIVRTSTNTTNKTLAREILGKKRTEVVENRHLDVKKIPNVTFYELCTQYWELHGKNLRMNGLENMIEIWKTGLGDVPLTGLTRQKIEKFLNDRMTSESHSPATRNRHLVMMKSVFNKGKAWGMLDENPAASIKNMREHGARSRFLTTEEITTLLSKASKRFRPILLTALHTGMRRGEIFKLKWTDVDFRNHIITIQAENAKSGKRRAIPMDATLTETLKGLPSRLMHGLVFPTSRKNEKGEQDPNRELSDNHHSFRRLADKLEIEDIRFHDLRHTFASHLVMNGVDLKTVQELLGHANLTMTLRYSHLAPAHQAKAVKILDTAYQTATDTKTDTVGNPSKEASASPLG
jgi:integrase